MSVSNTSSNIPVSNAHGTGNAGEKQPKCRLSGLKYWKDDFLAGLTVSLAVIPVSIGIALASGAPPLAGLIAVMAGGFVAVFLGGTNIAISGPAAGLAPAIYGAVIALGHGNIDIGYSLLLPLIMLVGFLQVILSRLKIAEYGKAFPIPVVEGVLSAIGIMVIAKMFPLLIGYRYQAYDFWGIIMETPHAFLNVSPSVFILGVCTLAAFFFLVSLAEKIAFFKYMPVPWLLVTVGTLVGLGLHLNQEYLLSIPANPLANGIIYPDFVQFFHRPDLWGLAATIVITLVLIDGVESLSSITAIDKIDPYKCQSEPNRNLFARGVSNMASSLFGGLPVIPGIVRGTAGVLLKGKTLWTNVYTSIFVLLFLCLMKGCIALVPLTVLAAMVIHIGYGICRPSLGGRMFKIGAEQFFLYAWTILLTLFTDVMIGLVSGTLMAILINVAYILKSACQNRSSRSVGELFLNMFRSPISQIRSIPGGYHLYLDKPLVSTNVLHLLNAIAAIPKKADATYIHMTNDVLMLDHSSAKVLFERIESFNCQTGCRIEWVGIEKFTALTDAEHATRLLDIEFEQLSV